MICKMERAKFDPTTKENKTREQLLGLSCWIRSLNRDSLCLLCVLTECTFLTVKQLHLQGNHNRNGIFECVYLIYPLVYNLKARKQNFNNYEMTRNTKNFYSGEDFSSSIFLKHII